MMMYYENGKAERISMRKAYRMWATMVDDEQKEAGTTFTLWLAEMVKMGIFN